MARHVLSLFYLTHLKQKPEKVKNEGILYKMQRSFMGCNTMNENWAFKILSFQVLQYVFMPCFLQKAYFLKNLTKVIIFENIAAKFFGWSILKEMVILLGKTWFISIGKRLFTWIEFVLPISWEASIIFLTYTTNSGLGWVSHWIEI